jgi:hypothetical protein
VPAAGRGNALTPRQFAEIRLAGRAFRDNTFSTNSRVQKSAESKKKTIKRTAWGAFNARRGNGRP